MPKEWEYMLAAQVCDQYSCTIWFPCLVKVLEETRVHCEQGGLFAETHFGMQFILYKLQTAELIFELESGQHTDHFQVFLASRFYKFFPFVVNPSAFRNFWTLEISANLKIRENNRNMK